MREPSLETGVPTPVPIVFFRQELIVKVIIGIDPHESTHTAVAIDNNEPELCSLQVRANITQTRRLLEWAAGFETRTWAIEGAAGLGYLLGQQLLGAGEYDTPTTARRGARPARPETTRTSSLTTKRRSIGRVLMSLEAGVRRW